MGKALAPSRPRFFPSPYSTLVNPSPSQSPVNNLFSEIPSTFSTTLTRLSPSRSLPRYWQFVVDELPGRCRQSGKPAPRIADERRLPVFNVVLPFFLSSSSTRRRALAFLGMSTRCGVRYPLSNCHDSFFFLFNDDSILAFPHNYTPPPSSPISLLCCFFVRSIRGCAPCIRFSPKR